MMGGGILKRSRVISLAKIRDAVVDICMTVGNDQITVYAAQATFFIIVSSIPFIILLLSLAKYVVDVDWLVSLIENQISGDVGALLKNVLAEVTDKAGASLVSITAVTTLWSSSRGVHAVTQGVCSTYGIRLRENFLFDIIRSLIYTVAFILLIIGALVALVFANSLRHFCEGWFPAMTVVFDIVDRCSKVVFTLVLTLFFSLLFNAVSKKGKRLSKSEYMGLADKLPRGFLAQLPGAAVSALGWVLFSYIYSLYINYYPRASYIYGSLAAIVFLMLWMYVCMIILLAGAEVNKFIFLRWGDGKYLRTPEPSLPAAPLTGEPRSIVSGRGKKRSPELPSATKKKK